MKTKIWRKINERVRIVEGDYDGYFKVEGRKNKKENWYGIDVLKSYNDALIKKHEYTTIFILRDLGYRSELVYRRLKRKNNATRRNKSYV